MYIRKVFIEPSKKMLVIRFLKKYPQVPYRVVAVIFGYCTGSYICTLAKNAGLPKRPSGRIHGVSPWRGKHDVHVQKDGTVLVRLPGLGSWDTKRFAKVRTAAQTPKPKKGMYDSLGRPLHRRPKQWQTMSSVEPQEQQDQPQAEPPQAETAE